MALIVALNPAEADENVERRMPLLDVSTYRSPLPVWYSRKPLQDITNAIGMLRNLPLDYESKKLKKMTDQTSGDFIRDGRIRQATERKIHNQKLQATSETAKRVRQHFR